MAYTLQDALAGVRHSRGFFIKHLKGIAPAQWDWKPYPECKSVRETLAHLVVDDWTALESLQSQGEPNYRDYDGDTSEAALLATLEKTHAELLGFIERQWTETPLDAEVKLWGWPMKLGAAVAYLSAEDLYHSGQIAFIRMATDPTWDYYSAVYGPD
jgi:uncharacterized damage-inducible protein DinB